jgi:hypothetical protein
MGYPNDVIIENNTFVGTSNTISIAYSNGSHINTRNSFILGTTIIVWLSPQIDVYMNYWNPYQETDSDGDGIGDFPYVYIATDYANYSDNQPLMEPVPVIPEFPSWNLIPIFSVATISTILLRKKMFHQW